MGDIPAYAIIVGFDNAANGIAHRLGRDQFTPHLPVCKRLRSFVGAFDGCAMVGF